MNTDFRDALLMFQKEKGISEDQLCEKVCNAIAVAARKEFGVKEGITCEMDKDTYELRIFLHKTVVEEVMDERTEISVRSSMTSSTTVLCRKMRSS